MNWLLLDSSPVPREHFTLRQLRLALQRLGHRVSVFRVVVGSGLQTPDVLEDAFRGFRPDRIVWCDATGLPYFDLWSKSPWLAVPKIMLWFDEPVISVERFGLDGVMKCTADRMDVFHGVWDGYWRGVVSRLWGIRSRPIHLAVDEFEYHPSLAQNGADRWGMGRSDEVVFIGMLHQREVIRGHIEGLPRGLRALGQAIQARLEADLAVASQGRPGREIPSRDDLWRDGEAELRAKERVLLAAECERDPGVVWRLRWALWALAKNTVRIRVLRKALEVAPLAVFCEQQQLSHAREAEWRELLGCQSSRLRLIDTSAFKAEELGQVYHYGGIHIQATDPQSVEGGIPYRVFQTAASGRVLLTDIRKELMECFAVGQEILGYQTPDDFAPALGAALADRERWPAVGQAARLRVEREHTWRQRIETIEGWIAEGS